MIDTSLAEPLLDENQAAALLSVSKRTLQAWRLRGNGPAFSRIGASIRYCPHTLAAWVRSRRTTVATPRKQKAVTVGRRKLSLPPRMAELLAAEIAQAFDGAPRLTWLLSRRLAQALQPHETDLALALEQQAKVMPDGRVRLFVRPHSSFPRDQLGLHRHTVPVDYDPRTARYSSPIGASLPGFDSLCAHVWRLRGYRSGTDDLAASRLLQLIGAAYLALLAEEETL